MSGRPRPGSDLDVGVFLDESVPEERFLDMRLRLARRFAERLHGIREVDVVVLNEAPLRLAGRVISRGTVIFSRDEPVRVREVSRLMREYLDFQMYARPIDAALLRLHAEGRR